VKLARFAARRALGALVTLLVVATVAFFLLRTVPGGPFDAERTLSPEVKAALLRAYRLDAPLHVQYLDWLGRVVLHGDLGPTTRYPGRSVGEIVALALPVSIELGLAAAALALVVGLPLGGLAALRVGGLLDRATSVFTVLGLSVPRFVLAPLLVLVFALELYWLPPARWESWRHVVLPAISAGLPTAAYLARLTRAGVLEVLSTDWLRTARAKGLDERTLFLRHVLPAALVPVLPFVGPALSGLLVGSVVVERIFDVPGLGRYLVEAAQNRDYNLVLGVMLVYGALVVACNAVVDVLHALVDPRLELDG
jgi:oligopeptide transport system permease protein